MSTLNLLPPTFRFAWHSTARGRFYFYRARCQFARRTKVRINYTFMGALYIITVLFFFVDFFICSLSHGFTSGLTSFEADLNTTTPIFMVFIDERANVASRGGFLVKTHLLLVNDFKILPLCVTLQSCLSRFICAVVNSLRLSILGTYSGYMDIHPPGYW